MPASLLRRWPGSDRFFRAPWPPHPQPTAAWLAPFGSPGDRSAGPERGLNLDHELDLLADHDAARGQHHVGGDPVIVPVDLAGGGEAGPGAAVRVRAEPVELDTQLDRVGDALDREVTDGDVAVAVRPDAGRVVGHRRMAGDIQEVLALHIAVSRLVAAREGVHLDGRGRRRLQRVLGSVNLALELQEAAP